METRFYQRFALYELFNGYARPIMKSLETDYPRSKTTGYSANFIFT